jgi:hypothetical protein
MNTKRITAVSLTLFLALVLSVTPVLAGPPHFSKLHASNPDNAGNLTVSYNTAGVYSISGSINVASEAVYACKPADGNFPLNPTKQVIPGGSSAGIGPLKGDVTFPPPLPPTFLTCDEGMIVALAMVTYSGLEAYAFYDNDFNYIYKSVKGTFSATYYGYKP